MPFLVYLEPVEHGRYLAIVRVTCPTCGSLWECVGVQDRAPIGASEEQWNSLERRTMDAMQGSP
jgi:hypothetical protein